VQVAASSGMYDLLDTEAATIDELLATLLSALSTHVPSIIHPPHRPLVVAGPFGTRKRLLLQRLFAQLPDSFVSPSITTTRQTPNPELDGRPEMVRPARCVARRWLCVH